MQDGESEGRSAAEIEPGAPGDGSGLARSLGLVDATMLGVGAVLGAGTYAIIGEATALSGSMIWLSLLLAAGTALCCAGVYAEFVARYPDAGGGYEFIARGFGRPFANVCGVVLFATGVVAAATIAIAFSQYLGRLVELPTRLVAPAVIVLMGLVNAIGIRGASWFNIGATIVTLLGLALVVAAGAPHVGERSLVETGENGMAGVFGGAAMAFFAFVGFEDMIKSVEETRSPRVTMPRALLISGAVVLCVNVAIGIASVSVVPWQDLAGTEGPLSVVLSQQWGDVWGTALTGMALVAMSKTILSNILGGSRLAFDMGRDTDLPGWISWVWPRTQTPVVAVAIATVLSCLVALIGDLGVVATISNLTVLALFLLVNAALWRVRVREASEQTEPPAFRLPLDVGPVSLVHLLAIGLVLLLGTFNVLYLAG